MMTANTGHILDTNPYGREYQQILSELCGVDSYFDQTVLKQIYTESWLQVFDCLDYDFIVYGNKLQKRPIFQRFIGHDIIAFEHDLCNRISNGFKKLAVDFYYDLLKFNILEVGSFYIMTKLGEDYIVVCKLAMGEFNDTV